MFSIRCRTSIRSAAASCVRASGDIHQHLFEVVQHCGKRHVAVRGGGLPIEAVVGHELLGALTLRRQVEIGGSVGAHELDEHHLRPIEVVAQVREQHTLAQRGH